MKAFLNTRLAKSIIKGIFFCLLLGSLAYLLTFSLFGTIRIYNYKGYDAVSSAIAIAVFFASLASFMVCYWSGLVMSTMAMVCLGITRIIYFLKMIRPADADTHASDLVVAPLLDQSLIIIASLCLAFLFSVGIYTLVGDVISSRESAGSCGLGGDDCSGSAQELKETASAGD